MTEYEIAAPLAAALAEKGYASLTPVQTAVIAPELAGRDALVSAQTGSGKTVAFGLAMAQEVLGGHDKLTSAGAPHALIIAPTRELAQQVARELEWLYAKAGAQIATCVGGMDYRTEKRALDRGAHIVVGTPGRLRDHIERRSLDMSFLSVAVLDEADEMLDLGFAEDLEFILSAAPEDRRTLMFSATVPKEIEKLAGTFQRNAVRIQTAGEARQHGDIQYRAVSVTARDREHAIFNVLRFYEARTAIVFCKTRMNVNHLLARMGNRGFQVVALSGELSQSERMHALQALRDGRARVCIATDVAARGIDLPGLDLVIHADLPSNSETLLHRSGRTGRAGNKGTSVLIVPPSEARKAQRLLQGAKVVAEWDKAPSADEVQQRDDERLLELPLLAETAGDEAAVAARLVERYGADNMAAAFVRLWRQGRSAPEVLQDTAPPQAAGERPAPRDRNDFGEAEWFLLSVGHEGRAEARWLLPKICDGVGITRGEIGAIRVQQTSTFVQISKSVSGKIANRLELEPGLVMDRLDGEPQLGRPERPARPERAPRPERAERAPRRDDSERAPREFNRDKPAYQPKPSRFVEDGDDRRPAPTEARKPYAPREGGERKPWAGREDGDRKPYAPREAGERKPWAAREDSERKPYARRDSADAPAAAPRKPYAPRAEAGGAEGGDRKPRWKGNDKTERTPRPAGKAAGFKSHGGGDKPARSAGLKSHKPEGKTFGARPARAKPVDARDTSKRFTPPKRG